MSERLTDQCVEEGGKTTSVASKSEKDQRLLITIEYGEMRAQFSGEIDVVMHSLNAFVADHVPAFRLARQLSLNYGLQELAERFRDYLRMNEEGPWVTTHSKNISDKQLIALHLVGQRVFAESYGGGGKLPSLSLAELQSRTALNPKTVSSRLSELTKAGSVTRESSESGATTYRISTQGIAQLIESIEKK